MESLGREPKPRSFNPLFTAKVLAWAGGVWLVLGTIGVVYLVSQAGGTDDGFFFGNGAQGRIYALLTLWPGVFTATLWAWAVAAFLWWRGTAK